MSKRLVLSSDTLKLHHSIRWPQGDILVVAGDFNINDRLGKIEVFWNWLCNPLAQLSLSQVTMRSCFRAIPEKVRRLCC